MGRWGPKCSPAASTGWHGAPLLLLQVEQGLGIGTRAPLFNRMEAQSTRFWKLTQPLGKHTPVTLVTHCKVGNALGDLPAYDAYLLGGPFSGGRADTTCRWHQEQLLLFTWLSSKPGGCNQQAVLFVNKHNAGSSALL